MSYIIIGGGITGLYCAYSLHKKLGINDITIIEKANRVGGRINSMNIDNITLEMGAGVIAENHHREINLLRELNLHDKLEYIGSGRSYAEIVTIPTEKYTNNSIIPTIYHIENIIPLDKTDFYDIMDNLYGRMQDINFFKIAINYTLYGLIEKFYGVDKADQITYQFGFNTDITHQNSYDALLMFRGAFLPKTKIFRLNGGLIQIIDKLVEYLKNNGIKLLTHTQCIDISKDNNKYICILDNNEHIYGDHIIFAITKRDILKIKYFDKITAKLNSVVDKALIRIYLFFPQSEGKVWFDDIRRVVTTKTFLRQIVPINKEKGILMIYCDGEIATNWYILYQNNILEQELMYHLIRLFSDRKIPEPNKIVVSYYENATHVWKPGIDSRIMFEDIMKPIDNENIYIVGETYSLIQQWSEGALDSVDILIDKLTNNISSY